MADENDPVMVVGLSDQFTAPAQSIVAANEKLAASFDHTVTEVESSSGALEQLNAESAKSSQSLNGLNASVDHSSSAMGGLSSTTKQASTASAEMAGSANTAGGAALSMGEMVTAAGAAIGAAVGVIGAIVGAATVAGMALLALGNNFANVATAASASAQMAGTTVQAFSSMSAGVTALGGNADHLQQGLQMVAMHLKTVLVGGGELPQAFQRIGLSMGEVTGQGVTTSDIVLKLADKFHNLADGAQKTAVAQELLGRGGAALIPILNQGSDALKKQMKAADELGVSVTQADVVMGKAWNQTTAKINELLSAFETVFTRGMMPVLNDLATMVKDHMQNAWDGFIGTMGGVKPATEAVTTAARGLMDQLSTIANATMPLFVMGADLLIGAFGRIASGFETTIKAADLFAADMLNVAAKVARAMDIFHSDDAWAKSLDEQAAAFRKSAEAAEASAASIHKLTDATLDGVSALLKHTGETSSNTSAINANTAATGGGSLAKLDDAKATDAITSSVKNADDATKNLNKTASGLHQHFDDAAASARNLCDAVKEAAVEVGSIGADIAAIDSKFGAHASGNAGSGTYKPGLWGGNGLENIGGSNYTIDGKTGGLSYAGPGGAFTGGGPGLPGNAVGDGTDPWSAKPAAPASAAGGGGGGSASSSASQSIIGKGGGASASSGIVESGADTFGKSGAAIISGDKTPYTPPARAPIPSSSDPLTAYFSTQTQAQTARSLLPQTPGSLAPGGTEINTGSISSLAAAIGKTPQLIAPASLQQLAQMIAGLMGGAKGSVSTHDIQSALNTGRINVPQRNLGGA